MLRRLFASAAAAFALLFVLATFDTADARRGGSHGFSGGRSAGFSGRSFSGARFSGGARHFRGRNLIIGAGVPLAYGAYYYGYGDGCYWLKRRAINSGSGYWWNRYYSCVNGY
jgi:hypothetical protein